MDITVRNSVFDPNPTRLPSKNVYVRINNQKTLFKVWLYLSGNDLPFVNCVTYKLHSSFPERVHQVKRSLSNPNCTLQIWTWGLFEVGVEIQDKRNKVYKTICKLSYDKELTQGRGQIKYIYE